MATASFFWSGLARYIEKKVPIVYTNKTRLPPALEESVVIYAFTTQETPSEWIRYTLTFVTGVELLTTPEDVVLLKKIEVGEIYWEDGHLVEIVDTQLTTTGISMIMRAHPTPMTTDHTRLI